MLESVELGSMSPAEAFRFFEDADDTLVYFIVTYLRERYARHPAAEGVLGRLVALCDAHPQVMQKAKAGQSDSLVTWFEDEYRYRDFESADFIELIVEKLEG